MDTSPLLSMRFENTSCYLLRIFKITNWMTDIIKRFGSNLRILTQVNDALVCFSLTLCLFRNST